MIEGEFRVRPKEAREAREIIRRHDPALAFHLDALFPVEECRHDWKKGYISGNRYRCGGCGEKVMAIGMRRGYWITEAEWKDRCRKMGKFFEGDRRISLDSVSYTDNKTSVKFESEVYVNGEWRADSP